MNCLCRTVYRAVSHSCRYKRFGALLKLSAEANTVRCSSSINQVMFSGDNNIAVQASLDMKRGETIYKKDRLKVHYHKYLEKCFSKDYFSPDYVVSSIRASCSECGCSSELVSTLLMKIIDFLKENNIQLEFTADQKRVVLKSMLRLKYLNLLKLACFIFKMGEEPQSLKELVDELVRNEEYIKAAYCIGALSLQENYDVEKILIPILLNGQVSPVIFCLSSFPDLQLKIAQTLDSFLIDKNLKSQGSISVNSKNVYKTISAIVNAFKIPPEKCKNLHFIRSRAAINILIKKKYQQSITDDTWEDMVMTVISKNPLLKEHLIHKLVQNQDIDTAIKMVSLLDMKDFDVSLIKEKKDTIPQPTVSLDVDDEEMDEKGCSEEPATLELSLDNSCIHFIDTEEKFFKCISDITQNYKLIGVDSEWKPYFGLSEERLSLVQLAVHDKVYILDMIALNEVLQSKLWDTLIDCVFASSKIVKLGCNIMSDVQMIVSSNKTKIKPMRFSHTLDMSIFYRKLQEVFPEQFSLEEGDNPRNTLGLSKLCEMLLGKSLSKEERLCDWEKRPLTETQLQYAALDAYCLLQVYDALKEKAKECDMKFDHLANVALVLTNSQSNTKMRTKRKLKQFQSGDGFLLQKAIPIQKFKVLIDSELDFLGDELKQFGADVLILSSTDTSDTALQIANSEERLLICSESLWNLVQGKVENGICINDLGDLEDISASHIIQRFNVRLSTKHMVSHCSICDSKEVIRLSSENMDFLQKWTSNNNSIHESDLDLNSFHKTVLELSKSGIEIKAKQDEAPEVSAKQKHLCLKCGVIQ